MNNQMPVTIVMVEDDEGHARLIEKNIRRAGISNEIRHFLDGGSALEYLFNAPEGPALNGPALVLLDLNLPDMSGTDILQRLKQSDSALKRTPVVVLMMLLSCTVIGQFGRPAKMMPNRKSFQMPVTCRMSATTVIGTDIGSMMWKKMRQKPAPSTRAALKSSTGSAA